MSLGHGAGIIRSGLVLYLDAANKKSYPGTGTVWTDLSDSGNNGTLVNGTGYNSANNGSIVFDGVNDYAVVNSNASIPYGAAARTVNVWCYTNNTTWVDNQNTLFFYGSGSTGNAFGIDFLSYPIMEVFTWGGPAAGRDFYFNTTFSQVGWKNISVTYDGTTTILIYENGIFTQTFTLGAACNTTSSSVYIGALNPSILPAYYDGNISNVSIYNRVLTAVEVKRNFQATRGRYNV